MREEVLICGDAGQDLFVISGDMCLREHWGNSRNGCRRCPTFLGGSAGCVHGATDLVEAILERCPQVSSVMVAEACPSICWTTSTSAPDAISRLAALRKPANTRSGL